MKIIPKLESLKKELLLKSKSRMGFLGGAQKPDHKTVLWALPINKELEFKTKLVLFWASGVEVPS
jgi:hypothetical protein